MKVMADRLLARGPPARRAPYRHEDIGPLLKVIGAHEGLVAGAAALELWAAAFEPE